MTLPLGKHSALYSIGGKKLYNQILELQYPEILIGLDFLPNKFLQDLDV